MSLRSKILAIVTSVAVVGTVGLLGATNALAATSGTITGLGGKCVDVAGASTTNGTAVQLYDCNGTAAQSWTRPGDGTIRALGKCLDATNNSSANGNRLQIWDCAGSANQKWTVS